MKGNDKVNLDNIVKSISKPDVILLIIMVGILIVNKIFFKLNYFSVGDIIKGHFMCFKGMNGKYLLIPILNNISMPIILAIFAAYMNEVNEQLIDLITVIVSIITAMLFSLLTMVIDMKANIKRDENYYSKEASISNKALIQTYQTIMYEILISVVLLIFCLYNAFSDNFGLIQSFIIYFLSFSLILNLLMIMKRIYKVIDIDLKK